MRQVTVSQTTCEELAAEYLGDATQAIRIMRQNGLLDPDIIGVVTLVIPDTDPTKTGGLPPR